MTVDEAKEIIGDYHEFKKNMMKHFDDIMKVTLHTRPDGTKFSKLTANEAKIGNIARITEALETLAKEEHKND